MKRTDESLVGRKIIMDLGGRDVVATIDRLDATYPATAYSVVWVPADNPGEAFPVGVAGMYSIAHCSQVLRAL